MELLKALWQNVKLFRALVVLVIVGGTVAIAASLRTSNNPPPPPTAQNVVGKLLGAPAAAVVPDDVKAKADAAAQQIQQTGNNAVKVANDAKVKANAAIDEAARKAAELKQKYLNNGSVGQAAPPANPQP